MAEMADNSSSAKGMIYLCQKVRRYDPTAPTNSATSSQIWHKRWTSDANTPPVLKMIRSRARTGQGVHSVDGDDDGPSDSSSARSAGEGSSHGMQFRETGLI
ncbi:hypothetical protein F441_16029 [Phytophthora nicotianae CJ01A1]|uniref:Uncharacterized protein n=4 Tax=Phytophthora nicotianae TaxID=4792 RepID=V9EFI3_PHYNI|nr:hypothetical protein F443_16199 [Phytophthora nicotianae P1569]ETK78158.1 hypothetical protein L915_15761 [Phytophthora nicotianae]ETP07828.1 hypothetical protein F441_16029 [Phytophthora nicotianae CJ01A1]ETP35883.1 hypothetical protein F442_16051 [Phytophthora nicotianae P10297]ETL31596.1 hypothetical protein L916_15650 [Phytophthora nicotianae]